MAIPRIFVSSTCYDLHYIRENLKFFVKSLGYEPVLSEEGAVFFNPKKHTHDACLAEVPTCQMFVLIIGGRSGGKYKSTKKTITNVEYEIAIKSKIPVFTLVEQSVYAEHHVYLKNRVKKKVRCEEIEYPSVDDTQIFEFIDAVRQNISNNALVPFRNFNDVELYLRQQWAGMMFSFLTTQNESERVAETLSAIQNINQRVEMLSRQILKSVGTDEAKLTAALYDRLFSYECMRDLAWFGLKPSPRVVLKSKEYLACVNALGAKLKVEETDEYALRGDCEISKPRFEGNCKQYTKLRDELEKILKDHGSSINEFLNKSDAA